MGDDTVDRADRVVVLNPTAGSADHADRVRALADGHGLAVAETEEPGDPVRLAREAAADGASLVAAAGGDGTVNEVVRGLSAAGALGSVRLAVVPAGTGNNFAGNLGLSGIEHGFDVIDGGEARRIDLGFAGEQPFVNSAIAGLTAEASAATEASAKARIGVMAYLMETLRTAVRFEGLPLHIEAFGPDDAVWSGEAAFVLVGNGRRFPAEGRSQADMEDGLLDVTVVEDRPTVDLVGQAAVRRLLGGETSDITHLLAAELSVTVLDGEPATFSLDGEMTEADSLELGVEPGALPVLVGDSYEPTPGE